MICKSLTIHKSQGMIVGHGKQFTKVVVHLPVRVGGNKCPGLELVAVSRAVESKHSLHVGWRNFFSSCAVVSVFGSGGE